MHEMRIGLRRPLTRVQVAPAATGQEAHRDSADSSRSAGDAAPTSVQQDVGERALWSSIDQRLMELAEEIHEIELRRSQSLRELQEAAVELAIAIASCIVHRTIERNDFAIEGLVAQMIDRLEPGVSVSIRLHPDDLQLLRKRLDGKPPPSDECGDVQFVADASLSRGDCAAEAGDFGLVSQIESQQSDLRKLLLEELTDAQIERRKTQQQGAGIRRYPDRRETA